MNITHHSNGTISYRRIKFWYFDLSLSAGNLTDTVTTLNMPAVGAAEFAKGDFLSEFGVSDMLATIEGIIAKNISYFIPGQTICEKNLWVSFCLVAIGIQY